MSIPFKGFIGPSYNFVQTKVAAVERCVNFYLTKNEWPDEESKFDMMLAPSPGNAAFSELPVPAPFNQPCRGLLQNRGKAYGVNGTVVFQLKADGSMINVGTVVNDGKPVSMVANGNGQIFIASGGIGYVIPYIADLTNALIPIISVGFLGSVFAAFQDGYILSVLPNSNTFQISGDDTTPVGDATKWSALNVSVQAGQADFLRAIISSREYVHLFGDQRSQIYQNVGNQGQGGFPFANYNETFIETGIAAAASLQELGGSLMWIGQDARGMRAAWRDSSFNPIRASTFAIEQQWQDYHSVSDAVAMTYEWRGHVFYQVTFPRAFVNNPITGFPAAPPESISYTGATWVYDVTMSDLIGRAIWHERQFLNSQGNLVNRPERFHCAAYGLHLVGSTGEDGNPGAIYQYSDGPSGYSDCAVDMDGAQEQRQIVRDRIAPHLWSNNKLIIYNRIEFELARGVGLDGDASAGTDPTLLLRWSNDGGNNYGAENNVRVGKSGAFSQRAYWTRNGAGRDRVYWVRCTDPVYWCFTAAMLDLMVTAN